ncbi:hypothetical protein PCE1_000184 [Barthelona sp. PCE]
MAENLPNIPCDLPQGDVLLDSNMFFYRYEKHGDRKFNQAITFSPDSNEVFFGAWDGSVIMWNPNNRNLLLLHRHSSHVRAVAAFRKEIVASGANDATVRIWNRAEESYAECVGHKNTVTSVCFSHDGRRVISGSEDNDVRIWDLDGNCLAVLEGHVGPIYGIAAGGNGRYIASCSKDCTIRIWDQTTGEFVHTLNGHDGTVESVHIVSDKLISVSRDRTARFWNLNTYNCYNTITHTCELDHVFVRSAKVYCVAYTGHTFIYDMAGETIDEFRVPFVRSFCVSPNGNLAYGHSGAKISLYNPQGNFIKKQKIGSKQIFSAAVSATGNTVVHGMGNGVINILDVPNNNNYRFRPKKSAVYKLSANDEIITTGVNNYLIVYTTRAVEVARIEMEKHISFTHVVPNCADYVYVGLLNGTIVKVDIATEETVFELTRRTKSRVMSISVDEANNRIITTHSNKQFVVWDLETCTAVKQLVHPDMSTNSRLIEGFAFTTTGDSIIEWEIETENRNTLCTFENHTVCVQCTPCGRYVVGFSRDNRYKIFDRNEGEVIKEGHCRDLGAKQMFVGRFTAQFVAALLQ